MAFILGWLLSATLFDWEDRLCLRTLIMSDGTEMMCCGCWCSFLIHYCWFVPEIFLSQLFILASIALDGLITYRLLIVASNPVSFGTVMADCRICVLFYNQDATKIKQHKYQVSRKNGSSDLHCKATDQRRINILWIVDQRWKANILLSATQHHECKMAWNDCTSTYLNMKSQ